ncbi:MAG: sugar O-acetyltransferase [Blautia sp.]|jgi:maltose O-acetyltransferase
MTQKERMLAELLYRPDDAELVKGRHDCRVLCHQLNLLHPDQEEERVRLLKEIFGKTGENIWIESPFFVDYGSNTEIGETFYANANCVILDTAKVTIGKNVMLGPNVGIYTAGHPLDADQRNSGWEYGVSVTIGDNVWIGGNSVINPGVCVGNNVVIGSGSVVTKDIPDNCIAAGNPARVLREITRDDKKYYFKKRPYDTGEDGR